MIPDTINIEKYIKEYMSDVQNDDFLMNVCKINEDVEYILSDLNEDENIEYDEKYINEIVDVILTPLKKLAKNKLADNEHCYDILFAISQEYVENAKRLIQQEISKEEKYKIMYDKMEQICDKEVEEYERMAYEKEMFVLQHPILNILQKITIPLILIVVVLWIIMTLLVANGIIELPF